MPSGFPPQNHRALPSSVPRSSIPRDPSQAPINKTSMLPSTVPSVDLSKYIIPVPSYVPSDSPSRAPSVVKILATYPQVLHMQLLQLSLLIILDLCHNIYQVEIHTELQVLYQTVYHIRIIVQYNHLYQYQVHQGIQAKHLKTSTQICFLQ